MFSTILSLGRALFVFMIALMLAIGTTCGQEPEAVLSDGKPALKYKDKQGCETTINFAKIAGQEDAAAIRVVHFHGSLLHGASWGEKGWLGITRSRVFFRPDPGQQVEHGFNVLKSEFKKAKVSIDDKIYYLTIESNQKKNQEFSIGCFGPSRDVDNMFVPVLNFAALACNNFDAAERQFQQLTASVQPQTSKHDTTDTDPLGISPQISTPESSGNPEPTKGESAGDAKTFFNLGRTHLKLELYDEAIKAFKQAVQIRADYAEAFNGLGDGYLYSGRAREAISAYNQAIKINPNLAEAYNGLGIAYSDNFQPEDALKALKQAVKLQPNSPSNSYFLGIAYIKLGKRKEAIEALKEAVRLNPKFEDAYENLGKLYSNSKEYAAAVEVYRLLVQLRPKSPAAHSTLANSYFNSGRNQEALDEYELTIGLSPKEPSSYNNIANTYAAMGRFDEAIQSYKRAISLKSDYVPSHFMLGRAFFKNGNKASAMEQYNILKTLDPNAAKGLLDEISK